MISLIELANSVLQKTQDGKLTWSELSAGTYLAVVGEDSLIIERKGAPLYAMRFVNSQGVELAKIDPHTTGSDENTILAQIYDLARRQVLRVDERLLILKRSLDRL